MIDDDTDLKEVALSICEDEDFKFQDELGGGSFKKVYKVLNPDEDVIALKVIRGQAASERTQREVEAIQRCDHPNIAELYLLKSHQYEDRIYDYILEEFIEGDTLHQFVTNSGLLTEDDLFDLGNELIDTISYLKTLELVHRDIKPENIIFRADMTPVLVDFGIVRDLSASSLTHSWAPRGPGTPYFASPEQLNNEKHLIDWRTDQFAVGVVLCYIHFGIHPWEKKGDSPSQVVEKVANREQKSELFYEKLNTSKLKCLNKMTGTWPILRYRKTEQLQNAWSQIVEI